jgi:predicted PurR-regulated permease PerM
LRRRRWIRIDGVTVGIPIVLILLYALLTGVRELDVFLRQSGLEQFRSALQPYVDVASMTDPSWLVDLLRGNTGQVVSVVAVASIWLVRLFVALVVAFYLLRDDRVVARWFRDVFEDNPGVVAFAEGIDDDLTMIYTGNLLTIVATGLVAVVTFYAFDLLAGSDLIAHPLLLGMLVPVVGIKLVYVPYTAVLVFRSVAVGAIPVWIPVVFFVLVLVVTVHFLREILPELVGASGESQALE